MPIDLIHKNTVKHFTPCSYELNRYAHGKNPGWQHLIQLGSAFTRPTDIAIQSALYPIFRAVNPFITVGINFANKKKGFAVASMALLPFKLAGACIAVLNFEGRQVIRLAWSLSGNWIVNGIKGERQTNAFIWKRIFDIKCAEIVSNKRQIGNPPWSRKKIHSFPVIVPKDRSLDTISLKSAYSEYLHNAFVQGLFSVVRYKWHMRLMSGKGILRF